MARSRTDLKQAQDQRCISCAKPLQERDANANTATPNKNTNDDASKKPSSDPKPPGQGKRLVKKDEPTTASSLASIRPEGEETESVPIYATANDVRRDIKAHLSKTNMAKATFVRELSHFVSVSTDKVTTRHLDSLLKMKGPRGGAHSPAFYAAYVFFEKMRVRDGKKKGVKREKMEEVWAKKGGMQREGSHNLYLTMLSTERSCIDQYGCVQIWETGPGGMQRLKCSEAD
ncbi:hypothetical protein M409DRAFT_55774 [Zasmidium cellare ATCC 36951]|uniref:DUF7726 domain-containing protein n=1 Tax=Zasmidium cellare ATCC 36951 TaxID=1080233 RepID=A0A6A6CHE4_ZASCE|nr:uncharacterized protein M409DRAFT_55774 [Zasmidium cellare ATCC 36951]KAF2165362.1 hypothetical protein M409DRAFT_55774 [Zasmidium cellare ATCC 36951]